MANRVLSPDSEQLTFICGLGWPEVSRYYLSRPRRGMWEFWEQPAGLSQARLVFAWLPEEEPSEAEAVRHLLGDYLGAFKATTFPKGETVQGLLSIKEIQRVLRKHSERSHSSVLKFPLRSIPSDFTAA
jgi:hypothetical protein